MVQGLWIRPRAMFLEPVVIDGKPVPRFSFLEETSHHER
jgi:hypothetical protein